MLTEIYEEDLRDFKKYVVAAGHEASTSFGSVGMTDHVKTLSDAALS